MTAREVLWKELPHNSSVENENTIINKMKEYAKEKCQQLLEIVADKAQVTDFGYAVSRYSIMNAVNLDEFINQALSNGYKPNIGLEIDRIDGTKDYSVDNCRFVTKSVNILNCKHIKLAPDDVLWIRSDEYSMEETLNKFTCSENVIQNIRDFKTFKDII